MIKIREAILKRSLHFEHNLANRKGILMRVCANNVICKVKICLLKDASHS